MSATRVAVCALCCVVLAGGCEFGSPSAPPEWPKLDIEGPPEVDVRPSSAGPATEYSPWPLGEEPKHGTLEWRQWCLLRYNSRDIVRPITIAPKIDGKLNDSAWAVAAFKAPFVDATGNKAAPETTVYVAYDTQNLYVAARVQELYPTQLRATATPARPVVRMDDHIAISLAPKWRERAFAVCWFLVNSKGVLADGLDSNTGWTSEATVASVVEQTYWTVEMAVPLKAFGVKADDLWGQVWGCRLERSRYAGGSHEASAWTRLVNAKTAKGQWGHVIFKGVRPPKKEPPKPPPKPPAPKGGPANPE